MRAATVLILTAGALGAVLALGGCTTTRADGSPKVETTNEANREGIKGAAESPLRDLNVLRTKIPDVLLQAMADPYERPLSGHCPELIAELKPLNDALGSDLDSPAAEQDGLLHKGKTTALGFVAGAASDVIPFHGWVRKLSGAERHDRMVQD